MRPILIFILLLIPIVTIGQQRKLLLVAGQSNARGSGDMSASPSVKDSTAFEYSWQLDSIYQLNDPVGENYNYFQQAISGSSWPSYANTFHSLTGDTLILIPAARGGTSVTPIISTGTINWSSSGILWDFARQKTESAILATGLSISGMVWMQGEKDALGINSGVIDKIDYKAALLNFFERVRQKYGCSLPIYMVQTGTDTTEPDAGFEAVREAQLDVANEDPFTSLIYDKTVDFPSLGWMSDNIHYNQKGYNDIGMIGATAAQVFLSELNSIATTGPLTFCEGDSLILTAAADFSQYLWSNGKTQRSITVKESGTFYVTVSNGSCAYVVQDSVIVNVNPSPNKPILEASGPTAFCEGGSLQLNLPSGDFNYQWNTGETTNSITIQLSGQYYANLSNTFGCTSQNSDTIVVVVTPLPERPNILVSGATTFCEGDSIILEFDKLYDNSLWSTGEVSSKIIVTETGEYFGYGLEGNCLSESSDTIEIEVIEQPDSFSISVENELVFCEGDTVLLSAPLGQIGYLWSNGENTQTIAVYEMGNYSCTVTNAENCSTSANAVVSTVLHPRPKTPFIEKTLLDSLYSIISGEEYTWYFNNQELSETERFIFPEKSGNYQVAIKDSLCSSLLSLPYLVEHPNGLSIDVFSSPNQGKFTVELNNVPSAMILLQIVDNLGRVLSQEEVIINRPVHRVEYNFPSLVPSVYYAVMHYEKRVLSKKFIVN